MIMRDISIMALTAAAQLLFPLSGQDQDAAKGTGCQLSFDAGGSTYVYAIGHDFMIKTGAGRTVCRISDRQFAALPNGGSQSCAGHRLTIRETGRVDIQEASDSSSAPATLSVTNGDRSWTVHGNWGTAC